MMPCASLRRYASWIFILIISVVVIRLFTWQRKSIILPDDSLFSHSQSDPWQDPGAESRDLALQDLQAQSLKARLQRLNLRQRQSVFRSFDLTWTDESQDKLKKSPKKMMAGDPFQKLVHLDLKGAAPRMEYMQQLLPYIKQLGATGILVEYEDMFPYGGDLSPLRAPHAYSKEDIQMLMTMAKDCSLTVIPLVQTFGHFEFVLKHEQFDALREVPQQPFAVCPRNPKSVPLVEDLLNQVMQLHPDISHIHIGADEVWNLGLCSNCQAWMSTWMKSANSTLPPNAPTSSSTLTQDAKDALFLDHVITVTSYLKEKYPKVKAIMWDDMFRDTRLEVLTQSQIGKFVQPMVWKYTPILDFPADMWDRYAQAFDTVWVASAFKGATGPNQYVTEIAYHIENHLAWLSVVEKEAPKFKNGFHGIALTGWQRYDHFAVVCETLPVGTPSLALCLQTIHQGEFTPDILSKTSQQMGFSGDIPIRAFPRPIVLPPNSQLSFPGKEVYELFNSLANMDSQFNPYVHGDMLATWFNPFHVKKNFTNPWRIQQFSLIINELLQNYMISRQQLNTNLQKIFFPDTVEEILGTLFDPKIHKLEKLLAEAERQVLVGGRPSSNGQSAGDNSRTNMS